MGTLDLKPCPFCGGEAEVREGNSCRGHCPYDGRSAGIKECTSQLARDALTLISRWISVEERLPERGITKCSACVKCGDGLKRVVCASYNAELKLWTGWHGEKIGNEITHWMPLPEPPKEE